MGTLPNPQTGTHRPGDPSEQCQTARWCDEPHHHRGPCRQYLGEARAGRARNPAYIGVAVVGTTHRDRRLELSAGAERLTLDWTQTRYLANLLQLAHKSYAT